MDFKAIIDLVKYTLALGAACFVYTLEKLVPVPAEGRWLVLTLLGLFVVSAVAGILIFSAATAAQHGDPARAVRQKNRIRVAAYVHIGCLALGILLLGGKLVHQVFTEVPEPPQVTSSPSSS